MAAIPTADEHRRKAEETRPDPAGFKTPDIRAKMLEIAAQYERLARRAEEFSERAHWRKQ
jgi:hypothetical protein